MLKKITLFFPAFIITFLKLFLVQFSILTICRICFYFCFKTIDNNAIATTTILKAFKMGFEFDMVASTYALFLPTLLLFLNQLFYKKTVVFHKVGFVITLIVFCLYALVSAADFPYYKQFNSHLNKQAFLWAASPSFVLKLIFGNISYYGYLLVFIFMCVLIYKVLKKIFKTHLLLLHQNTCNIYKSSICFVLLIPFLIFGARGRISGKSTTHEGLAIISDNLFINQIALNPNFTFFRSVLFQKTKNYVVPTNIDECIATARNYLGITSPFQKNISRIENKDSVFKPYNVVIICMESMSTYKMGANGTEVLTPNFNNIVKESVYFDRFFSSGIHTFNGLFSIASGYPSMLVEHGLRRYTKKPFITLGNLLEQKNYQTSFYCTHDPHFDNMQGFFTQNGYKKTYSSDDLPKEKTLSATGVPDHELYNLFFKTINNIDASKPFLSFIMTGSDHGPWRIPKDIPFIPTATTEEKRATQYADWALGQFIQNAKKQAWYNNTLFVFLGDHGYSTNGCYEMPLSFHNIPLVLHKPNSLLPDTNHNIGYQPDIITTVAGVLNLQFTNTTFGINILKQKHPFVYFSADDKIGCISDDGYFFYELITQKTKRLKQFWHLNQNDFYVSNKQKADSLEKQTKQLFNAAEYFIRKEYYNY